MPELHLVERASSGVQDHAADVVRSLRRRFGTGATKPLSWRLSQLDALEHFFREREQDILDALRADLGKPEAEAFASEVATALLEIKLVRKNLRSWMKPEKVRTSLGALPGRSYLYREPLGVVLIIGAWNYPVHLATIPLIGALAAGNCAVVKPSEVTSATSALLSKWLPKYLDRQSVRVFEGGVPETTALLREKWDHIFYTGNARVARIVMEAASKHITPVTLELGGKSPCIVDETADLDEAAKRIVFGKFFNAGQTCLAPDYVLAHHHVHDALVNRMVSTIREFYGDEPKLSPDFGRIVNERHHSRLTRMLMGADVVVGGQADAADRFIAPTIVRNVKESDPVMQEEIFGPILPVISVSSVGEAIAFTNRQPKPLALYLFSTDESVHERVLAETTAGGTTINHVILHHSVADLPFGGVGESGIGAYHGRHSFETFSNQRGVLKKPNWRDVLLMYPPYSLSKLGWIRRLL